MEVAMDFKENLAYRKYLLPNLPSEECVYIMI